MSDIDEKINNAVMDVLLDTNAENKKHIERLDNALKRSYIAIIFVVCLLFATFIYSDWSFKKFVNQFDFESDINTTNDIVNKADVFEKNSNVNATISDIKIDSIPKK